MTYHRKGMEIVGLLMAPRALEVLTNIFECEEDEARFECYLPAIADIEGKMRRIQVKSDTWNLDHKTPRRGE